jgi:large subunit ribosomal protein L17
LRHGSAKKKLGRTMAHRRALLRNLVRALLAHERIQTTLPKAKEVRRYTDRMVRFALKNTLAARREVARFVSDRVVLKKLFDEIGPRFTDRAGGYTRIYRLGPREGDGAEMALIELVIREETHKEKQAKAKAKKEKGRGRKKKAEEKPAEKKGRAKKKA